MATELFQRMRFDAKLFFKLGRNLIVCACMPIEFSRLKEMTRDGKMIYMNAKNFWRNTVINKMILK